MWGSPAPVQTEAEEVEGLKQMFAQPASPGGTQMGLGTYMKLSVANENRRIADKGREEKRELDALMETWAEDLGLKSTEELEEWIEDFESDEEVSDYSIDGPGSLDDGD